MSGPEVEKVRYKRARLTLAKSGTLTDFDRLAEAIGRYERGEVRPATVAIAYLRARIVDHSPSFRWRGARLSELIPLVTSVSADPVIEAETSRQLADELVRLRAIELAAERVLEAPPTPAPPPRPEPRPPAARPEPVAPPERVAPPEPVTPRAPSPRRPALPRLTATPEARRRLVVLVGGLAALAIVIALVANYLGGASDRLADDYREQAGPALKRVGDAMDAVFDSLDLFVSGSETGLAIEAIKDARNTIEQQRPQLADVPDPPAIGAGDAIDAIEAARASGEAYLKESSLFLDEFERFLELEPAEVDTRARDFYELTIDLSREVEALEETIFSLGTGNGDAKGTDHYRPATPTSLTKS